MTQAYGRYISCRKMDLKKKNLGVGRITLSYILSRYFHYQ